MSTNALGEYLRARRELVKPQDAGVRVTGVRRTPGLRREEVATLAGISADYYLRLEQGRDRNPSAQVLEALARVFDLDAEGLRYLMGLGGAQPPSRRRPHREVVPTGVAQLVDALDLPAFVEGRTFDVLAANPLATAVSPEIRPGRNRLRSVLLDPAERDLYLDREVAVAGMVAGFRTSLGPAPADPEAEALIAELSEASEEFRTLWARQDVKPLAGGSLRLAHPAVGMLHLRREKFPIGDAPGQLLAIYHAERGSESAQKLALLGSLAAAPGSLEDLER